MRERSTPPSAWSTPSASSAAWPRLAEKPAARRGAPATPPTSWPASTSPTRAATARTSSRALRRMGYIPSGRAWAVGENLAWGTGPLGTPAAIVRAWMNSPGHRANILDPRFRQIGLGIVAGNPAGRGRSGATYARLRPFGSSGSAGRGARVARSLRRRALRARSLRRTLITPLRARRGLPERHPRRGQVGVRPARSSAPSRRPGRSGWRGRPARRRVAVGHAHGQRELLELARAG